jgi:hypothetical protein
MVPRAQRPLPYFWTANAAPSGHIYDAFTFAGYHGIMTSTDVVENEAWAMS